MGGTHAVWRGTGKAEAAKLQDAGISLKQSYIRECQEKHLPLGSVPRQFSLGIQPTDWACTRDLRVVFLRRPVRFVARSGETLLPLCGSISRL
jgi:hypothetical protein